MIIWLWLHALSAVSILLPLDNWQNADCYFQQIAPSSVSPKTLPLYPFSNHWAKRHKTKAAKFLKWQRSTQKGSWVTTWTECSIICKLSTALNKNLNNALKCNLSIIQVLPFSFSILLLDKTYIVLYYVLYNTTAK